MKKNDRSIEDIMNNTKVTIIVEGLGKQIVHMPFEEAVKIYANVSKDISNSYKERFLIKENLVKIDVTHVEEIDTKLNLISVDESKMEKTDQPLQMIGASVEKGPEKGIEVAITGLEGTNPFVTDRYKRARLVASSCPHCGTVTIKNRSLYDSNIAQCHYCNEEYRINSVTIAEIGCPTCPYQSLMFVEDGISEINCGSCKSSILLTHNEKGDKLVTID